MRTNTIDDVVLALEAAPIDQRTGNKVLYSVNWVADRPSMIGNVNPDWVRRELDWFNLGSNRLEDMEAPVPKLFEAVSGTDGTVNSAYGHILFSEDWDYPYVQRPLYNRALDAFLTKGKATRHAVVIVSDRDIHTLSTAHGRNDFICTNALNLMIDAYNQLHIVAQMRSMDAVFGYRADWSMWDDLMERLLVDLEEEFPEVTRGDITFQVANLHVYPRHLELLASTAYDTEDRIDRRVWDPRPSRATAPLEGVHLHVSPSLLEGTDLTDWAAGSRTTDLARGGQL